MPFTFPDEDPVDVMAELKQRRQLEIEAAKTAEERRPRAPEPPPALRSWYLPSIAVRIFDVGQD